MDISEKKEKKTKYTNLKNNQIILKFTITNNRLLFPIDFKRELKWTLALYQIVLQPWQPWHQ